MGKITTPLRSFWLTILTFTFIVNLAMLRLTYLRLTELKADLTRSTWSGMLAFCFVIMAVCIWLMVRDTKTSIFPHNLNALRFDGLVGRILGGITFLVVLFLIPYIKFAFEIGQEVKTPVYDPVLLLLFYYWMCWWLILLAMTALKAALNTTGQGGFAFALVWLGVVYEAAIDRKSVV